MEKEKVQVGLFGAAPDTTNLGVSALFSSTVERLKHLLPSAEFTIFDNGIGKRVVTHELSDSCTVELNHVGARAGMRYYRPENLATISVASRFSKIGRRVNFVVQELDNCDAILDISGGDSFSDIYGTKRFLSITRPKISVINRGVPLILLPQTYGPYNSDKLRKLAVKSVKASDMAWARDLHSFEILKEMLGDDYDERKHYCGVDCAFALGVKSAHDQIDRSLYDVLSRENASGPLLGLNVNGLVYNDPSAATSQYGFRADYCEIVHKFCEWALSSTDATIVIVPHVMSPSGMTESDFGASQMVVDSLPEKYRNRLHISPRSLDQNQAKWVISHMDWFCGTRMHSTIASLSSGGATATVAYSDKTIGVFESCGQGREVFDPRTSQTDEVVEGLKASFLRRDEIRTSLKKKLPDVMDCVDEQFSTIANRISTLAKNNSN